MQLATEFTRLGLSAPNDLESTMQKKSIIALALCAGVTALWSTTASAGQGMNALAIAEHIFAKTDVDNDGSVTLDEYTDAGLDQYGASFEDFDLDNNKSITLAEYRSLFIRFHPHTKEKEA